MAGHDLPVPHGIAWTNKTIFIVLYINLTAVNLLIPCPVPHSKTPDFLLFSLDLPPCRCYPCPMTISLPPDLDARFQQKMHSAGCQSPDDLIRKALDALDAQEQASTSAPMGEEQPSSLPIWEEFEQAGLSLPERVLAALPTDGASEHDHYIYGTPKHTR